MNNVQRKFENSKQNLPQQRQALIWLPASAAVFMIIRFCVDSTGNARSDCEQLRII